MKVSWIQELPQLGLIALMLVLAAVTWAGAPAQIPVRWDLQGEVTRYGGKAEGLLLLPALALAVYLFLLVLRRIDPHRANYPRFEGAYHVIRLTLLSLIALAYGVVHLWIRGYPVDATAAGLLLVGLMLIMFGVASARIEPNWFIGIRTPWTLSSRTAWQKTHRAGGWVFALMGLWSFLLAIVRAPWTLAVWVVLLTGGIAGLVVYSYLLWRADTQTVPGAGTLPAQHA